jgi:ubiquinone/menaquinone biosynthesis C-methylase UbiE
VPEPGSLAAAYSAAGTEWQRGPGRIYDRLAETVVDACPVPLPGRLVLDLGTGTGAATRALLRAGARVVAVDNALGMLLPEAAHRPPAAAGEALALPFAGASFAAVVASFCLNHLDDPAAGLAEAARVTVPGGAVVASAYAADDDHPVKGAVEEAAASAGWTAPPWLEHLKADTMPRLATAERMAEAAAAVPRLVTAEVARHDVPFPDLSPSDLVAWRLGMAQMAEFVAALDPPARAALSRAAQERLGPDPPPLVRRILILTALAA